MVALEVFHPLRTGELNGGTEELMDHCGEAAKMARAAAASAYGSDVFIECIGMLSESNKSEYASEMGISEV